MKILLIYPRYLESSSQISRSFLRTLPPVGLLNIAGFLQKKGHKVKILDVEAEKLFQDEFIKKIGEFKPQLAGISTTTSSFGQAKAAAKLIKNNFSRFPVVLGGPHLTLYPELSMEYPEFDAGVIGEGEISFSELADCIAGKKSLEGVPGIIYRENGKVIRNRLREYIENIDSLPFSAWELVDLGRYHDIMSKRMPFAPMVTSRGCPYDCIYCDRDGRMGRRYRAMSAERIYAEVEYLYKNYGVREVCFYDDTFTVNKNRIREFCGIMRREKLDVIWECRTRVDLVDEELLKEMASAGCYRIRFGVETANPELLKFLKKNINLKQAEEALSWSRKYGIETMVYFMLGVPYENSRTAENTINFAVKADPDYAIFSPTNLAYNDGTELYKWAAENKYIASGHIKRYLRGENVNPFPLLETREMPGGKLLRLSRKAYRKFYMRPKVLIRELKKVRSFAVFFRYFKIFIALMLKKFEG